MMQPSNRTNVINIQESTIIGVGDNVNMRDSSFKDCKQSIVDMRVDNSQVTVNYGPQDRWDANKLEDFVQKIRTHLCHFYQTEAKYVTSLSEDDNQWPIVETYRQLALVTATESRILYVVKALDATQLPDASMFASPAVVVTATREAYFIEQGRWLRDQQSGSLIRIQGVVLPKNLEAIQESDPRRVIEHEGASQIVKQVMEKYAHVGGREAVLRTYETPYEHYEKR